MTIVLGFGQMKQCQDVKMEHSMYMQIGLFLEFSIDLEGYFHSS